MQIDLNGRPISNHHEKGQRPYRESTDISHHHLNISKVNCHLNETPF